MPHISNASDSSEQYVRSNWGKIKNKLLVALLGHSRIHPDLEVEFNKFVYERTIPCLNAAAELELLEKWTSLALRHIDGDGVFSIYCRIYGRERSYLKLGLRDCRFDFGFGMTDFETSIVQSARADDGLLREEIRHDRALFLTDLGRLEEAEELLRKVGSFFCDEIYEFRKVKEYNSFYYNAVLQNLMDVLILKGRLRTAELMIEKAVQAIESTDNETRDDYSAAKKVNEYLGCAEAGHIRITSGANHYARRALIVGLRGKVKQALLDFKRAEKYQQTKLSRFYTLVAQHKFFRKAEQVKSLNWDDFVEVDLNAKKLVGQAAVYYAELLIRTGRLETARKILSHNYEWSLNPHHRFTRTAALASLFLSDVHRYKSEYNTAAQFQNFAEKWAEENRHPETCCRAYLSGARLNLFTNELEKAGRYVDKCVALALKCGFKLFETDCRVTAARVELKKGESDKALKHCESALKLADDPDCSYAWGKGNALHLMGEILLNKGDVSRAENFLKKAAELRMRMEDPRLLNTRTVLKKIRSSERGG